jgi:hypothetical protein
MALKNPKRPLPTGLRQFRNFNHLVESGTLGHSIEFHSFLARVSHRNTARNALTITFLLSENYIRTYW